MTEERKRSYPSVKAIDPKELSRIRISMELSQEAFAESLGINPKTVSSAENGKRILELYAIAIAKGLGKAPEELFDFPDKKPAEQTFPKDQTLGGLPTELLTPNGTIPSSSDKEAKSRQSVDSPSVILGLPNGRPPIYLTFLKTFFLAGLLLIVNWIGEQTTLGNSIKLATYGLLQHRLAANFNKSDLPIVVLDISGLPQTSSTENKSSYTSRQALRELIAAAAGSGARAVGIDIDFSPDQDGYISPDDPNFFQFCLQIKEITGVPIYLGINRSQSMPASAWLGEERYKELAATTMEPRDSRRMLRWFQTVNNRQRSFSISASLAGAFNDSMNKPSAGLVWAIRSERDLKERYFSAKEFWVDYGPLDVFEQHIIPTTNSAVIRGQSRQLQGRVVLFGDIVSGKARDISVVPGRRDPVPGALVHACATYTLLNKPLYSLTFLGRMTVDFFISFVLIGGMLIIQMTFRRKGQWAALINNFQVLFIVVIAGMVILVGWGLVDKTRLLWDDCFLVAVVLLAYKPIERGARYLRHVTPKIWQSHSRAGAISLMSYLAISKSLILTFLILGVVLKLRAEDNAPPHYVGWIEEIQSPAFLKSTPNAKPVALDPKQHRFRFVQEGELVHCDPGGRLKVQIGEKFEEIKASADWHVIHRSPSTNPEILEAIESYGHIGGRDRPILSDIFSPFPGSTVRGQWAVFRWIPSSSLGRISLVIKDTLGHEIWRQDGVDGASGLFTSDVVRTGLETYARRGHSGQMFFGIINSNQEETRVPFALLSVVEEKALDGELEHWDHKETGLLRHVGRAFTFDHYKLYTEAAAEHDAALALAPESEDLLTAAIAAYEQTGNIPRANELKRMLHPLGN